MMDLADIELLPEALRGLAPGTGRLAGKRAVVVGGGQRVVDAETDPVGNGRAISLLFAREGADVTVVDRSEAASQATVDLILEGGGTATSRVADVTEPAQIASMIDATVEEAGGIDILVLNAGIAAGKLGLENTTPKHWDLTFAVNARGPMLCVQAALPHLSDRSSIVFVSSISAKVAGSQIPAYDASKAALGGLMRQVALEGRRRGIRANIVCPGPIDTPMGRAASSDRPGRSNMRVPLGRFGVAWDVAYAALYLASDESQWVTAQEICVDGGTTGIS